MSGTKPVSHIVICYSRQNFTIFVNVFVSIHSFFWYNYGVSAGMRCRPYKNVYSITRGESIMKKQSFRRIAAGLAACVLMASALPMTQFTASAANLISNSTFDSGSTDWGIYKESGGSATLGTDSGRLALHISSTGKLTYAVQMYYDIIPLYQNGVYRLKYDISCTTNRYVEGMIQQNGGTYQAYTWKGLDISPTPQTVDYQFTMTAESDIMAKLVFNCGLQEKDGGDLGEHTIYLDNVSLELVDDSNVDYGSTRPYEPPITTNQVGYRTDSEKIAVIRNASGASSFSVVDAQNGQVVYTNTLSDSVTNSSADETDQTGDFSALTEPGTYYITCDGLDDSYPFTISDSVYDSLLDESVKMLYLQRCGCAVDGGAFSHPACHTAMATVYGTGEQIDVSGGWHDAGDYGRYIVPAAKAVADLLYAYQVNPSMYGDDLGIPESGNGKADVLDEVKYELDWMFKMQTSDGGVYHKVTCENFPGYVAPQYETDPLIVTPVSTTATADFAASMALAAEVYEDYDAAFAAKCLAAAEKAWSYLEQNPSFIFQNPEDIVTGEYGDTSDADERYWAAAQLYRTTGDSKYLNAISSARTGLDWSTVGDYGNIALLTMENIDQNSSAYQNAKNAVLKQANTFLSRSSNSPYGVAITTYNWGSNMTIANAGIILGLAHQLSDDADYANAAEAQLHYLLGTNPLGTCFVTGYGTVSPQNPHHRPSMAANQAMPGMLVGGVNYRLEDSAAKAYLTGVAPAKCYVDNSESYSTNEITIYWNSPLTYLLTLTDAEEVTEDPTTPTETTEPTTDPTETTGNTEDILYGDANCDNTVSVADVIFLNKTLMKTETMSDQGRANADVDLSGELGFDDSLNILKSLVDLVELPIGGTPSQSPTEADPTETEPTTEQQNGMNADAAMVADFRQGTSSYFFASDGWTNGSCFDCGWYAQNATFDNGALNLTINQDWSGQYNYSGAEYRTSSHYSYGYYETSMQAIKNDGVVSSFFTYTGPSENNPWDEIDIEILGKDTTKVQFNYYTNGVGEHEYFYDLGFDASEGFHTYGFDWQPDHITWYVDGEAVYTAYDNIPTTPGRIMMNVWPGTGVDEWLAPYDGTIPLTARYQWVTYDN